MDKLEQLAHGIKILEKDVCISTEGGAIPKDPRLDSKKRKEMET